MLGLASCQKDFNDTTANLGGEVDFQLSVGATELTRAGENGVADEQNAKNSAYGAIDYFQGADWNSVDLRYSLEVYDAEGLTDAPVKDRQVIIVDKYEAVSFDLRLVPNRTYQFVVFADFVREGEAEKEVNPAINAQANLGLHHVIGATLQDITIVADAINDESTDAYFISKDLKITNSIPQSLVLQRPYGKIRVIATDLAELNLNVEPKTVVVKYEAAHPSAFNAVTGAIEGEYTTVEYKYEYAEISKDVEKGGLQNHLYTVGYDAQTTDNANGVERHTHMTLFTDYILAEAENMTPHHFKMTVFDQNDTPIKETEFSTDIPVERNHLTTVIGNVLTTATEINITIDDNFADEYTYAEDIDTTPLFLSLLEEASNSVEATIDLSGDVVWATGASHGSTPLMGENAKTQVLTINGNGNTFTATGKGIGAIRMANGGKVIFNNVKFVDESVSYNEGAWELGYLEFAGNLKFNNCEFVNAIMVCGETANNKSAGNATFYNCSFNSHDNNQYGVWVSGNRAYFNECTFEGPRGLKVHEAYGSEVEEVVVDTTTFQNITKKPGIALGTLNADTTIVICNSTFNNCQAGDQGRYIYETDTDVNSFNFTEKDNTVCFNVATAEELKNAIAAVNGNVIVDANGAELNLNTTFTTAMVPAGKTATIRNANVTGRSYGNKVNGDVVFEGCSFNNANGAYSIHFDGGKGNVFFKNCALFGWNSFGTLNSISLEDCTLEGNGTYALLRSYTALSLTNCVVDITNANHEDEWPEGVEAIEGGTLTETNVKYVAGNEAALKAAIANGAETVYLNEGTYTVPAEAKGKTISIIGGENAVVDATYSYGQSLSGANITFEGVTIKGQTSGNYLGFTHTGDLTFNKCTFEGKLTVYSNSTFNNCVFNNKKDYAVWTSWGGNETKFVGCTFNSGGKALLLYGGSDGSKEKTLIVKDCVFNSDASNASDKAAIETGNDYGATYNLYISNTTVSDNFSVTTAKQDQGGDSLGTKVWGNKDRMPREKLNVYVDGVDVY